MEFIPENLNEDLIRKLATKNTAVHIAYSGYKDGVLTLEQCLIAMVAAMDEYINYLEKIAHERRATPAIFLETADITSGDVRNIIRIIREDLKRIK